MSETTYHESYGDVTTEQLKLYRKLNVSPMDHRDLADAAGGEDKHTEIIKLLKRFTENGMFSSYRLMTARQEGLA